MFVHTARVSSHSPERSISLGVYTCYLLLSTLQVNRCYRLLVRARSAYTSPNFLVCDSCTSLFLFVLHRYARSPVRTCFQYDIDTKYLKLCLRASLHRLRRRRCLQYSTIQTRAQNLGMPSQYPTRVVGMIQYS